jgi:hypothetical protein
MTGRLLVCSLGLLLLATPSCHTPLKSTDPGSYETEDFDRYVSHRPGIGKQILLYLPNRIVDSFDIVKGSIGLGVPLGFDIRITKWFQLALQTGVGIGLTWDGRDHTPLTATALATAAFGPWRAGIGAGSAPRVGSFEIGWGGPAGKLVIDVAEIVDFILGWFFLDIIKDDYGWEY